MKSRDHHRGRRAVSKLSKELRNKSDEELKKRLEELEADLIKNRAEARMGTLKNTSLIRNKRKEVAKILTIMGERKRSKRQST
ncbi:50S ribosomal protein L29 [Metallosphaera tengchongensis]|uniref:Large ribosomal subunit protein uL29 n=1 Tax=Metallosphaera tengchongensis TaxID=1532350 RepID=A0A6N0NX37_9CREN|nr:50S ribosomal protein L29 [Metallosphaera tengchongensis]